jgi:nucleoside-diphosphate-sugar epimerase
MKILVTGGLGLIGHNVVHRLENLGHDIVVVDLFTNYGIIPRDELDYLIAERQRKITTKQIYWGDIASEAIGSLIERHKIDTVVHLASFPRQKVVNVNPQLGSRTMSEGLLNLLELSVKYKINKFVYISSSMVYGDFSDQVREDAECRPQGQYGIMKLAGEWLVKDYTRKSGMSHTIIRPSAVYGPLDVNDRVISKFLLAAMRGDVLTVNGANETLDFTYVQDAADGIVAAALLDVAHNRTYNITKSHSKTLLEAAELSVRIAGKGSIDVRGRDLDFPSRGALNIDAARRDLGYNPQVDMEEGFEIYYQWLNESDYWQQQLKK